MVSRDIIRYALVDMKLLCGLGMSGSHAMPAFDQGESTDKRQRSGTKRRRLEKCMQSSAAVESTTGVPSQDSSDDRTRSTVRFRARGACRGAYHACHLPQQGALNLPPTKACSADFEMMLPSYVTHPALYAVLRSDCVHAPDSSSCRAGFSRNSLQSQLHGDAPALQPAGAAAPAQAV